VSVSYDLTVRIWPLDGGAPTITTLPSPLNAVAVARDGEIVTGSADGRVFFLAPNGDLRAEAAAAETPIIAIAISNDGALVAAAGIRGSVAVIERATRQVQRTLVGPGLPVWSAAFLPDNRTLVTGGTDRMVRRWDATTGDHIGSVPVSGVDDPLAAYGDDRGAQVYRACIACHTLSPDEGNRAGPTLHGIFGRRIASLPGYNFSEPLKKMSIVWTPETVAKLFEVGPMAYTPGTKMPEQVIGSADDRKALVDFLAKATK
jgi:cytochrome c